MEAFKALVENRLVGDGNMWNKTTKVKLLSWNTASKEVKLKAGSEVLTVKATSSLFD